MHISIHCKSYTAVTWVTNKAHGPLVFLFHERIGAYKAVTFPIFKIKDQPIYFQNEFLICISTCYVFLSDVGTKYTLISFLFFSISST